MVVNREEMLRQLREDRQSATQSAWTLSSYRDRNGEALKATMSYSLLSIALSLQIQDLVGETDDNGQFDLHGG